MKTEVQGTPKTLCIVNILQTMDNVQHNFDVINQPMSQTF
jgi:hypothetical protein